MESQTCCRRTGNNDLQCETGHKPATHAYPCKEHTTGNEKFNRSQDRGYKSVNERRQDLALMIPNYKRMMPLKAVRYTIWFRQHTVERSRLFFSNLGVSAYSGFSLDCYNELQTYQLQSRFAQHYYQLGQAQEFKMFEVHPERHLTDDGRPCTTLDLRDQTLLINNDLAVTLLPSVRRCL